MKSNRQPAINANASASSPEVRLHALEPDVGGAAHSRKKDRRSRRLARRLQEGDLRAIEGLRALHANDVVVYVMRRVPFEECAWVCDLVWETVIDELPGYIESDLLMRTWILEIAARVCLETDPDMRRLRRAEETLVAPIPYLDPIEAQEFRADLERALERVPPREREAFVLRHEDELTEDEIARRMDATPRRVRGLVAQCIRRLRVALAKWNPRKQ
jgi:RNA polymerase sigma-70 factor (ECF subfamily)